jgi:hypothetical protein
MDGARKGVSLPILWIGPSVLILVGLLASIHTTPGAANGAGWESFLDLGVAAAFGFLIRRGFRELREKNMVENVPASPIRSVAMGLAEIKGHAPSASILTAPLSGTACHFYRYEVDEERQSRQGSEWVKVDQGKSNVPFTVEDPTGGILVNPAGAEILLRKDYERIDRAEGWLGKRRRYREWRIDPGDFVYTLGTVSRSGDAVADSRELLAQRLRKIKSDPKSMQRFDLDANGALDEQEWAGAVAVVKDDLMREELARGAGEERETLLLGAGTTESTFLISDRDERSIASLLGWRALGAIGFGGAGVLVMVVSILGRIGLRAGGWSFPWASLLK